MARFTFTGTSPLYYTLTGLWAEPGKTYELAEAPDRNWAPEGSTPAVEAPAPAPATSPAEDAVHAAEALLAEHPELAETILKEGKDA